MATELTPQLIYHLVVNLDRNVYLRHPPTRRGHSTYNPHVVSHLPKEYIEWAETAKEEEVDRFWFYLAEGFWKRARKLSGLPVDVIADMMHAFHEEVRSRGRADGPTAYVKKIDIPVHVFNHLMALAPDRHRKYYNRYINNPKAPPFKALSKNGRAAFEWLADEVFKTKMGAE